MSSDLILTLLKLLSTLRDHLVKDQLVIGQYRINVSLNNTGSTCYWTIQDQPVIEQYRINVPLNNTGSTCHWTILVSEVWKLVLKLKVVEELRINI